MKFSNRRLLISLILTIIVLHPSLQTSLRNHRDHLSQANHYFNFDSVLNFLSAGKLCENNCKQAGGITTCGNINQDCCRESCSGFVYCNNIISNIKGCATTDEQPKEQTKQETQPKDQAKQVTQPKNQTKQETYLKDQNKQQKQPKYQKKQQKQAKQQAKQIAQPKQQKKQENAINQTQQLSKTQKNGTVKQQQLKQQNKLSVQKAIIQEKKSQKEEQKNLAPQSISNLNANTDDKSKIKDIKPFIGSNKPQAIQNTPASTFVASSTQKIQNKNTIVSSQPYASSTIIAQTKQTKTLIKSVDQVVASLQNEVQSYPKKSQAIQKTQKAQQNQLVLRIPIISVLPLDSQEKKKQDSQPITPVSQ